MKGQEKLCAKLSSAFLRKWWFIIALAVLLLLIGVTITIFFASWVNLVIDHEVVLRPESDTFKWWSKPPVEPIFSVYIYNVTNADDFLNNGAKPVIDEVGPYIYRESWEKVNIVFNDNGTVTYNPQKIYVYDEENSVGYEDDVVIVPNIPMLSATSQSKHAARFLRLAMASILDILKIKPFVEVSVGQLLWGYEDSLLGLAKEFVPKEQTLPYDKFGLFYGKNGTWPDVVTVFTGANDISKFGLINNYNGHTHLPHWRTESCNSLLGSEGSIFPPHITKNTTLYIYDKDLCRRLPLRYEKTVVTKGDVLGYRFSPPTDVFASVDKNPDNMCFCPHGPPCAPNGLMNVSLCQYDSPIMISFPHFYLADDNLRTAVEGISPPDPEKHRLYLDVQPEMGSSLSARARVQINLAVSQVTDIKQVATFPDIVFPILWFDEAIVGLPDEVTNLLGLATKAPPIAKMSLMSGFYAIGGLLLVVAIWRLIKAAHAHSTLRLNTPHSNAPAPTSNGHPQKENGIPMDNITK